MAGMGRGPRGNARGPMQKIENPGQLFKRLIGYMMRKYTVHLVVVVICIFTGVFAKTSGRV